MHRRSYAGLEICLSCLVENKISRMIESIRFYPISWSHYCDRVRWALDLREIPYEQVNYNPWGRTKGLERAPKTIRTLFPIVGDQNNRDGETFQHDSTQILLYQDAQYPTPSRPLFRMSDDARQVVIDTCLRPD
jgi:glutathione S-transferase